MLLAGLPGAGFRRSALLIEINIGLNTLPLGDLSMPVNFSYEKLLPFLLKAWSLPKIIFTLSKPITRPKFVLTLKVGIASISRQKDILRCYNSLILCAELQRFYWVGYICLGIYPGRALPTEPVTSSMVACGKMNRPLYAGQKFRTTAWSPTIRIAVLITIRIFEKYLQQHSAIPHPPATLLSFYHFHDTYPYENRSFMNDAGYQTIPALFQRLFLTGNLIVYNIYNLNQT